YRGDPLPVGLADPNFTGPTQVQGLGTFVQFLTGPGTPPAYSWLETDTDLWVQGGPIPEPSSVLIWGGCLALAGYAALRRRRASK
ncbi:MAG: PEP-CTERM sorting domain-containing protein, partial [Planctomycetota bacterium]